MFLFRQKALLDFQSSLAHEPQRPQKFIKIRKTPRNFIRIAVQTVNLTKDPHKFGAVRTSEKSFKFSD